MFSGTPEITRRTVVAIVISCITLFIYIPALQNGFVNWDDNVYVYENPDIRSIDLRFFKWIFTAIVSSNWQPLTLLSHALDYALCGLEPWGHHLTNIIIHSINAGFVFLLIYKLVEYGGLAKDRLDKKALVSGITTALLFGIHPLHVESVAWVSERKDVLCAFFFLLSLLAYLKYASINSKRHYYASLFSFVLALLSKPMAVSLPIVLLIIDFYSLERLKTRKGRDVFIEKVPFFLLSMTSSVVTLWAQGSSGAVQPLDAVPFINRIFVAMHTLSFYLYKMALPFNLAPYYPYPASIDFYTPEYLGAFVLLAAITIFSFRSSKLFMAVWLYYVVTLIPVIGIVQVGGQAAADRYTYLPSLGPFLLAGVGVAALYEKLSFKAYRIAVSGILTLIIGLLSFTTVRQISIWRDSITLWNHQIKFYPLSYVFSKRGYAHYSLGNYSAAIIDQSRAIEMDPYDAHAYYNRGNAHYALGNLQQAGKDLTRAAQIDVKYALAYFNLGIIHSRMGNYQKAIDDYIKAIEINPRDAASYNNLGLIYIELKGYVKAEEVLTKAIALDHENPNFYYNRGMVYRDIGEYHKAISDFRRTVELNPRDATAYNNIGEIYLQIGKKELGNFYKEKAADMGFKQASR